MALVLTNGYAVAKEPSSRELLNMIKGELKSDEPNFRNAEDSLNKYLEKCLSRYDETHPRCVTALELFIDLKKREKKYEEVEFYLLKIMKLESCAGEAQFNKKNFFRCAKLTSRLADLYLRNNNNDKYAVLVLANIEKIIDYNEEFEQPYPYSHTVVMEYLKLSHFYINLQQWNNSQATLDDAWSYIQKNRQGAVRHLEVSVIEALAFVSYKQSNYVESEHYLKKMLVRLDEEVARNVILETSLGVLLKKMKAFRLLTLISERLEKVHEESKYQALYSKEQERLATLFPDTKIDQLSTTELFLDILHDTIN